MTVVFGYCPKRLWIHINVKYCSQKRGLTVEILKYAVIILLTVFVQSAKRNVHMKLAATKIALLFVNVVLFLKASK